MREDAATSFSPEDMQALVCILDTLIPRSEDGRLPGAGELGLAGKIEETLGAQPESWQAIVAGLEAFRDLVARDGAGGIAGFEARSLAERSQLLNNLEEGQPALIPTLVFNTYGAYYQHPKVVAVLGIEAWPPHPKGYEMAPTSSERLDHVRRRPPIYRAC